MTDDNRKANMSFFYPDHKGETIRKAVEAANEFIKRNPIGEVNVRLDMDRAGGRRGLLLLRQPGRQASTTCSARSFRRGTTPCGAPSIRKDDGLATRTVEVAPANQDERRSGSRSSARRPWPTTRSSSTLARGGRVLLLARLAE